MSFLGTVSLSLSSRILKTNDGHPAAAAVAAAAAAELLHLFYRKPSGLGFRV